MWKGEKTMKFNQSSKDWKKISNQDQKYHEPFMGGKDLVNHQTNRARGKKDDVSTVGFNSQNASDTWQN